MLKGSVFVFGRGSAEYRVEAEKGNKKRKKGRRSSSDAFFKCRLGCLLGRRRKSLERWSVLGWWDSFLPEERQCCGSSPTGSSAGAGPRSSESLVRCRDLQLAGSACGGS